MADAFIQVHAIYMAHQEEKRRNRRTNIDQYMSHPVLSPERDNYKLRTSKWFDHTEISVVCSVLENGFIVERKETSRDDTSNIYGIAMWDEGFEKSKDSSHLNIYTVVNGRVKEFKLFEFWIPLTLIKISNGGDRFYSVNDERSIELQLERAKKRKFCRDQQFVCFCRYHKPKGISDNSWGLNKILTRFRAFSTRWR